MKSLTTDFSSIYTQNTFCNNIEGAMYIATPLSFYAFMSSWLFLEISKLIILNLKIVPRRNKHNAVYTSIVNQYTQKILKY